jgi:hypothetical protein
MCPTIHRPKFAYALALALLSLMASNHRVGAKGPSDPSSSVHALFDLAAPTTGPFPSDSFTVADRSQLTRRRVNLPLPDCGEQPSDCEDLTVVNTLDGFNLEPQFSIPFDGAIDVSTVTSATVFLLRLGTLS